MRKLLIFITAIATIATTGCSSVREGASSVADIIPNALDAAPFVYRPEIQQGNVVKQEQVNELLPGMSKRQVRFLLGTPMIDDVFHANRWDYIYTIGIGSQPSEIRRLTVFFQDDRLVRITGDIRPQPEHEREPPEKEVVVTVPDWDGGNRSFWVRTLNAVGLETRDD